MFCRRRSIKRNFERNAQNLDACVFVEGSHHTEEINSIAQFSVSGDVDDERADVTKLCAA
jgi:hypothetical protein